MTPDPARAGQATELAAHPTLGEIEARLNEIADKPNGYGKYQTAYRHYRFVVPYLIDTLRTQAAEAERLREALVAIVTRAVPVTEDDVAGGWRESYMLIHGVHIIDARAALATTSAPQPEGGEG